MRGEQDEDKEFEILKVNRYEVEENAIFLDYKLETLLSQINNYADTSFHIRLSICKNLKSVSEVLVNNQNELVLLLDKLSKDHQDMQIELLEYFKSQIPFHPLPENYQNHILKPLMNLANGLFLEVKQESCSLISQLAHKLPHKQIDGVIQFANVLLQSENQQNKIVSIQLLAKIAKDLPSEKRESIFQNEFLSIYSKSSVRVKKEVILELGKLAENIGQSFVDASIVRGFYLKQTKDNAWGIRKACVQIVTELMVRAKETKLELCNCLLSFLKDGNKFVRIVSHKILPEFLAKYGSSDVPKQLFDTYLSLIDLDINNQVSKPNEIIERVSYFFPGVLLTVGSSKWPQLSSLFNKLLHNRSEQVKKPLADSLHEISKIIGPENSKEYLFSSLDYILRQPTDSIKLCAIRNLAKFVSQFQNQTKENLIDVFLVLQKDPKKWRVRFLISSQLKYLSEIYDPESVFKYIFPISLKLCNDNVSEVRMCAAGQIIHVINALKPQQNLYEMAVQSLIGYAASEKFLQRQTFCFMLQSLHEQSEYFYSKYEQPIRILSKDTIPIVRIALAISLSNIIKKNIKQYQKLKVQIDTLCQDSQMADYFAEFDLQKKQNKAEENQAKEVENLEKVSTAESVKQAQQVKKVIQDAQLQQVQSVEQ